MRGERWAVLHERPTHRFVPSEDALFWPLLRRLFPNRDEDLTRLTAEHVDLDRELQALTDVIDQLDTPDGLRPAKRASSRPKTGHQAAPRAPRPGEPRSTSRRRGAGAA
ncbi:hypothetical protein GCM10023320_40570 [Pseudonocardia adelaidensis]|uniref:Uncharacterized protein n=1 Tax=Pseudonocardia adelaidensis TaxID=648754 RepID=A0ABP9NMM4_9PSEU